MASCGLKTEDKETLATATDGEDMQRGKKRSAESPSLDVQDDQLRPTPAKLRELDETTPKVEVDGANCSSESTDKEAKSRATKSGSTESVEEVAYMIVDQESHIEPALEKLRNPSAKASFLAVNCEGDISREGKLSIVSVGTESYIYYFDIKTLGAGVFDKGLRDLLEDPNREKLMFDCRWDSDCLWHLFKVKLANVLDLQLMQVIYRETHPEPENTSRIPRSAKNCIKDQPIVRDLLFCLKTYVKDEKLTKAEEDATCMPMVDDWMMRPLSGTQLKNATAVCRSFFKVFHELKQCIDDISANARLRQASRNYLDFFRSRKERSFDNFECNSFLPWRILPEYAGSTYSEEIMCVGCKRKFPRRDFSKTQLRQGCPVCKREKEEDDIEECKLRHYENYSDDDDFRYVDLFDVDDDTSVLYPTMYGFEMRDY